MIQPISPSSCSAPLWTCHLLNLRLNTLQEDYLDGVCDTLMHFELANVAVNDLRGDLAALIDRHLNLDLKHVLLVRLGV